MTAFAAILGLVVGVAYLRLLQSALDSYLVERRSGRAIALTLVRGALIVALLLGAARLGAWPLLAAFSGFLAARFVTLYRKKSAI